MKFIHYTDSLEAEADVESLTYEKQELRKIDKIEFRHNLVKVYWSDPNAILPEIYDA